MKARKSMLRQQVRRRSVPTRSEPERWRAAEAVWRRIARCVPLDEIATIAAYHARQDEIPVLEAAPPRIRQAHDWVVPAWDISSGRYRWSKVTVRTRWVRGPHGVPQPDPPEWVPAERIGLVLVPGVAFDRKGGRLGRGGGDYDRLLAECSCVRIGISWDERVVEEVPLEDHDQIMDWVVTERHAWKCARETRSVGSVRLEGAGA